MVLPGLSLDKTKATRANTFQEYSLIPLLAAKVVKENELQQISKMTGFNMTTRMAGLS